MQTCKTRKEFEETLEKQGISVLFRTSNEGRIYGATFIDHEQKCVFNGSRLGKDFSANVFNDLFKNDSPKDDINIKPELESGKSFNQENQGSDIGGIFDLFTPEISGDSYEEEAFIRRMKKKKRRPKHI
jgi:hypothetical protein